MSCMHYKAPLCVCWYVYMNSQVYIRSTSTLTVLKLWKRPILCGGGGVSMGNCRKGFMSRWGWITVGVRRKVGTAGPARFMPPRNIKRQLLIDTQATLENKCSSLQICVLLFSGTCYWIPKSTMNHNCTAKSNYFSLDRAKLCGTPVDHAISKLWERAAFKLLRSNDWTDILTSWQDWGTNVQQQMLWCWWFCGLCSIYIIEAFHYTKTFTSNEAEMPWRRQESHGGSGDSSTCLPVFSLLLSSPLYGDICRLKIMSFISACVALCRPAPELDSMVGF